MKEGQSQSGFGRFFRSRLFLIILCIIFFLLAISYGRAYYQDYQVRQKIKKLEWQVSELEGKKLESMQILQYVASGNFIEDKARTELNLKKPGENVIFVNGFPKITTATLTESVDERPLRNPMKWWYYFTHQNIK